MKPRNESEILRRRATGQNDSLDQSYQAPASFTRPDLYLVGVGDGPFPTTGVNTVFTVHLLGEFPVQTAEGTVTGSPSGGGGTFLAINLGEGIPVQDVTIVRCDQFAGQLFFTYRGNGSAS